MCSCVIAPAENKTSKDFFFNSNSCEYIKEMKKNQDTLLTEKENILVWRGFFSLVKHF